MTRIRVIDGFGEGFAGSPSHRSSPPQLGPTGAFPSSRPIQPVECTVGTWSSKRRKTATLFFCTVPGCGADSSWGGSHLDCLVSIKARHATTWITHAHRRITGAGVTHGLDFFTASYLSYHGSGIHVTTTIVPQADTTLVESSGIHLEFKSPARSIIICVGFQSDSEQQRNS